MINSERLEKMWNEYLNQDIGNNQYIHDIYWRFDGSVTVYVKYRIPNSPYTAHDYNSLDEAEIALRRMVDDYKGLQL